MIELKVSQEMHDYYNHCNIHDIAKGLIDRVCDYAISYSLTEYLKDLGLLTAIRGIVTRKGKQVIHSYYATSYPKVIRLIKPNGIFEFQRGVKK